MMQAIKHIGRPSPPKWYLLCDTTSLSASMAFDRLRMTNTEGVEVGIINPSSGTGGNYGIYQDSVGIYTDPSIPVEQIQPFHSGGGWTTLQDEHDFSFDCSGFQYGNGNADSAIILIRNISENNLFWQMYANPTGYSATRGKSAELILLYLDTVRIGDEGGDIGRIRLENQPVFPYVHAADPTTMGAKEIRLEGVGNTYIVAKMLRLAALSGKTDGTMSYDTISRPDGQQQAQDDYDTLASRNWSITGGRPFM
jgi:hypothetical protein